MRYLALTLLMALAPLSWGTITYEELEKLLENPNTEYIAESYAGGSFQAFNVMNSKLEADGRDAIFCLPKGFNLSGETLIAQTRIFVRDVSDPEFWKNAPWGVTAMFSMISVFPCDE